MNFAKGFWFLVILLCSWAAHAQQCKWLTTTDTGSGYEYAQAVTVDGADNVISIGTFDTDFTADTFHLYNAYTTNLGYIIKQDKDGNILWCNQAFPISTSATSVFYDVETDASQNIYVTLDFSGSIDFGNGISISSSFSNFTSAVVKYNPAGKAQWAKVLGINLSLGQVNYALLTVDHQNNINIGFSFNGTVDFTGTTQTLSTTGIYGDIGIIKYTQAGVFVNANSFGSSGDEFLYGIDNDAYDNIYILGYSDSTFTFGSQTLSSWGTVVLKSDSAYTPVSSFKHYLNTVQGSSATGIAVRDNGDFITVGTFSGTADFGGVSLTATSGSGNINSYTAYYNSNFSVRWVKKDDPASSTSVAGPIGGVFYRNSAIYSGGELFGGDTYFGSNHLVCASTGTTMYIIKLDTVGNFLWSFATDGGGTSYVLGLSADLNGNAILVGSFSDSITVFDKKNISTTGGGLDFFVAKLFDYGISRGSVSPGPYCAGDTLKIPYTCHGNFGSGNEFIAQLSDSAGNFDGGERELGRVTDTLGGTINGLLPLFNVASTNKYRIRIISTNPVVQSFYKLDTLRLLIYSKDTANAGPDTTICSGQSIRLGTTGGSRWRWSPVTGMPNPADTANRQPLVKPTATTTYRIIISDSSGCGEVDTDYVVVNVRPYITANINGPTTICRGAQAKLEVAATGGDSTRYWYQWKESTSVTVFSKDPYIFVNPLKETTYILTVGDSCSNKPAIVNFTLNVDTVLKVYKINDTTICKGAATQLKAWGSGCDSSKYLYKWYALGDTTVIGTNDTLTISPNATTQYRVVLRDTSTTLVDSATVKVTIDNVFITQAGKDSTICLGQSVQLTAHTISCDTVKVDYTWDNGLGSGKTHTVNPTVTTTYTVIAKNLVNGLSDTDKVTITVRPALSLSVNADSTICKGETAQLRATATGGSSSTYKINWMADNSGWTDTNFTATVTPDSTTVYTAVLSDDCTVNTDTARIKITVRPPLKVTVNPDTIICIGETAQLRAIASGGLPANWKMNWKADNGPWTDNKFTTTVNPTVTTTYTAILSDNCTTIPDSAQLKVTVRPALDVTVNNDTTICHAGSVTLVANTTGGLNTNHHIIWKENSSSWTDTNFTLTVSPTATTIYTATLTDNCTNNPDSAKVTVTVLPALSVTATAKDSICQGQTLTLNATPGGGKTVAHTLSWTAVPGTFTSNQNPAADTPQITTTYIVKLSDNCSPDVFDTLKVIVLPKPKADFTLSPTIGCPPLTVNFTDLSINTDSIKNIWHILTSEAFGIKKYTYEFLNPGTYSIGLTVGNSLGCTDILFKPDVVSVSEKPTASFTVEPDIKEVEKELLLINNSQKATNYIWDFGDGTTFNQSTKNDTTYAYTDSGYYNISLIAENGKGCKDTSTQLIRIHDRLYCAIPSAFTPGNNDNLNPAFQPVCNGVKSYTLTIYNRWGQVIQECENCAWDGTYMEKPVPSETYLYKIFIIAESGKKETVFGVVNVVR